MEKATESQNAPSPEQRILLAGLKEFADKGFFGARTQAIADAAGVNKAMLHYYFRSKENLYQEVIARTFRRFLTQVDATWKKDGAIRERLGQLVDLYLDSLVRNPHLLKIIMREAVDGGERMKRVLKGFRPSADNSAGPTPALIIMQVAEGLDIPMERALHFIMNVIGMCAISFVSPIMIEGSTDFDFSDVDDFLNKRRQAIKSMLMTYIDSGFGRKGGC